MALKSVCRIFGMKFSSNTLAKLAFIEIGVLAFLYFVLIILRYATPYLSHELFIEIMIIIGVGMAFDHYAMSALLVKGCDKCEV